MKKIILTFGLISGAISSLLMLAAVLFEDKIGFEHSYFLGYTIIVLSFLLVYFGIRSYRDNLGNGHITFAKAFAVGLGITLISCVLYVVTWEALYFTVLHDFMDKYWTYTLSKLQASGASAAAIQAEFQKVQKYKQLYENPFLNAAMTFIEPFPVGLVITLISSAILKKKSPPPATASKEVLVG
jgi:hypothetical protein